MAILFTDRDAVIAIPCVEDGLFAMRDRSSLMEGQGCVVRVSFRMCVRGLKVNGPAWFAVLLRAYDHPVAPRDRFADGDRLEYAKADVLVKACLHLGLPVDWDRQRCVVGDGLRCRVYHELQWGTLHEGEGLVITCVECAGFVIIQ
jgi:hypothetical protein